MPGTITVGCKLPHGLVLQLQHMEEHNEAVMGGGYRSVKRARRMGDPVTIKGFAHAADKAPACAIRDGFALTHGVDAEFFAKWLEQNKEHDAVKNGFVFASAKRDDVDSHAKSMTDRSGFEPCDPKNLPPEFKRKIETATRA